MKYKLSGELKNDSHLLCSFSLIPTDETSDYLGELVELLEAKIQVKKVTILKADTLQRHHIMFTYNVTENDAIKLLHINSEQWENKGNKLLGKLKEKFQVEILDWDYYLKSKHFNEYLEIVKKLYIENPHFKREADKLCKIFVKKNLDIYKSKQSTKDEQNKNNLSKYELEKICSDYMMKYIFEECAVFINLIKDEREFDYEFYPGERNSVLKEIYKQFVVSGRMKAITLLKDNKNINTQENKYYLFNNKNANNNFEEKQDSSLEIRKTMDDFTFSVKIEKKEGSIDLATLQKFSNAFFKFVKMEFYNEKNDTQAITAKNSY
jgi:hypothetical protein